MKHQFRLTLILSCAALLAGCSNPEAERAQQLYTRAEDAFAKGQLTYASALLDSIESDCKSAIEWRKSGHQLSYHVQLAQQEDSLATADTMLVTVSLMINELIESGKFLYEKGENDDLGHYWVKGTDTRSNLGRSYIHAEVNEYGRVSLISEYRGDAYINHTQLRLTCSDGSMVETRAVPLSNDGANYHFENQGLRHETVTYLGEDAALSFIEMNNSDPKFRATLLYKDGARTYPVQVNDKDLKAIALTYQLGQMLAAQVLYTQQSKTAGGMIQFLRGKINMNEAKQTNE
ncbi:MAG: hypothetical protein KBT20_07355 [Bacteroidales bacterium]|nr:hypothetical protein [Candidatus Liminaster caballi]